MICDCGDGNTLLIAEDTTHSHILRFFNISLMPGKTPERPQNLVLLELGLNDKVKKSKDETRRPKLSDLQVVFH